MVDHAGRVPFMNACSPDARAAVPNSRAVGEPVAAAGGDTTFPDGTGAIVARLGVKRIMRSSVVHVLTLKVGAAALLTLVHLLLARRLERGEYGAYSYAIMLTALLVPALTLGWVAAMQRFLVQYIEQFEWGRLRGYMRRTLQVSILTTGLGSIVFLSVAYLLELEPSLRSSLVLAACVLPLKALVYMRRIAFQSLHAPRLSVLYEEVLHPLIFIVVAVFIATETFAQLMGVYVGTMGLVFTLSSVRLRRLLPNQVNGVRPIFDTASWMRTALPMTLGNVSYSLLGRTGILLLGILGTMSDVGMLSAANRVALLFTFILGSVEVVFTPLLIRAYHGGRLDEYRRVLWKALTIGTATALPLLCAVVVVPGLILSIFGPEYTAAANVLRILAIGQFVNAATGPAGQALMLTGNERAVATVTGVSCAISAVVCLLLVPSLGALGAAIGTATGLSSLNLTLLALLLWRDDGAHGARAATA